MNFQEQFQQLTTAAKAEIDPVRERVNAFLALIQTEIDDLRSKGLSVVVSYPISRSDPITATRLMVELNARI